MSTRASGSLVIALVLALVLTACAGTTESVDKSGGDTLVLQLGTIDSVSPNGQYFGSEAFVDGLEEVSGGRLKVEILAEYGEGAANAESEMVAAIASGELDGGLPSTRAFANAGIPGLEMVEAPMTITSYEAQKALVSGPVAEELLSRLEGSGLIGLGLSVGPLRRPFAAEAPLLGPEDWEGARFRVYNSPAQEDVISALGGDPVNLSFGWIDEVEAGHLRGAEFDIAQYAEGGYGETAGHITSNVVLWPKVVVLSMSQARWDMLSGEQQAWVREAADKAVQVSIDAAYDETASAGRVCEAGARFHEASPEQITAMRERLAPVLAGFAADPLFGDLQAIADQHPAAEAPDVPAECRQAPTGDDPIALDIPEETSAIPEGVYRVDLTGAEVEEAGAPTGDGWSGIWTLTISDGTYALSCRPSEDPNRDCGGGYDDAGILDPIFEAGLVRGSGNTVFFVYDSQVHSDLTGCELPCFPLPNFQVDWELEGDVVTFTDLKGEYVAHHMLIKPWDKVG